MPKKDCDDAMSSPASDLEDWLASHMDDFDSHHSEIYKPSHADQDLLRIISKAVEKLNLEWSPPTELVWNRLDEWFL